MQNVASRSHHDKKAFYNAYKVRNNEIPIEISKNKTQNLIEN